MKYLNLTALLTVLIPGLSFAFFCPNNFNQIDYGNTIAQVTQQCGQPLKQETKKVEPNVPQEWSYFIPQTVSNDGLQPMKGTLKTQITFDSAGKVININVNGIGVGATTICKNRNLKLGDTIDQVKNICGTPAMINKTTPDQNIIPDKSNEVTELTYGTNPPVKLTFENGILTKQQ